MVDVQQVETLNLLVHNTICQLSTVDDEFAVVTCNMLTSKNIYFVKSSFSVTLNTANIQVIVAISNMIAVPRTLSLK